MNYSQYVYVKPHYRVVNGKKQYVRGHYRRVSDDYHVRDYTPITEYTYGGDMEEYMLENNIDKFPAGAIQTEKWYDKEIIQRIANAEVKDRALEGLIVSDIDVQNVSFTNCEMQDVAFEGGEFDNVKFTGVGLRRAVFQPNSMWDTFWGDSDLSGASIYTESAKEVNFEGNFAAGVGINLKYATDAYVLFDGNVFKPIKTTEQDYFNDVVIKVGEAGDWAQEITLSDNDMRGAELELYSYDTTIVDNKFDGSKMSLGGGYFVSRNSFNNAKIYSTEKLEENERHGYRNGSSGFTYNSAVGALFDGDFSSMDLSHNDMRNATLSGNYVGADFSYTDLRGADLSNAKLSGVELENAVIDETTKLPPGMEWMRNQNIKWEEDQNWLARRHDLGYTTANDPSFEEKAISYDIEAKRPINGGTSPVKLVKLRGDGLGVQKYVLNRPDDTVQRPNESAARMKWRIRVNMRHNGLNEVIAYRVSKLLGLDVVPDTVLTFDEHGRYVTIQKFIPNADIWKNAFVGNPPEYEDPENAAKIQLIDTIMDNRDRHEGNLMITKGGQLWAIDFGHARPEYGSAVYGDGELYLAIGEAFFNDATGAVPDETWERIKNVKRSEFYKMFDDLKQEQIWNAAKGDEKINAIWEHIEQLKKYAKDHY